MRTVREDSVFTVNLHYGSMLSPCLFNLIIDELTRHVENEPHDMLFANDIVLIDKTRKLCSSKLET